MENTTWRTRLVERHPWMLYLLPFVVYMIAGALEPDPHGCPNCPLSYAWAYAIKIALTVAAVAVVWPGYRQFAPRVTLLAILVGIVGGPLWIAICNLDIEHKHLLPILKQAGLGSLIGAGDRPAFNPFDPKYDLSALSAWCFMVVRFFGLVAVVPLIEEFFLRGFAMRFVMEHEWWKVPFGNASRAAIAVGTALPMLTHPGELLAAAVWFSMITWLMLKTRTIWDCVAAHALTNLILGVYVVWHGGAAWRLL
ncbi:MAG: CPBP family glutamic-type intramembrane protease [Thermoguttaceae bacterium]